MPPFKNRALNKVEQDIFKNKFNIKDLGTKAQRGPPVQIPKALSIIPDTVNATQPIIRQTKKQQARETLTQPYPKRAKKN